MTTTAAHRTVDKIVALQGADLFGCLPNTVLMKVAGRATIRTLTVGEVLFSEHDSATALYVVVEGELRSVRRNEDGREQVLSTERAGAVLAAVPMFSGGKFYSTTIADRRSEVLCIQARDVRELCREFPELLWNLVRVFGEKLRHYAELIETLALRNVDQRLAQHLLSLCQERGMRHGDVCVVEITMTQAEMASRLGSTREVVCRAIAHLQRCGLIQTMGSRRLTVPSMRSLGRFAG
ncbi:MAG TPA: Crp/Fnr family transcriptional regulator, partial [Bryobacteraceae bacterium]|nr:Crp/Fnr family transcriptional regulator [Bryobacteraceae bacterium]